MTEASSIDPVSASVEIPQTSAVLITEANNLADKDIATLAQLGMTDIDPMGTVDKLAEGLPDEPDRDLSTEPELQAPENKDLDKEKQTFSEQKQIAEGKAISQVASQFENDHPKYENKDGIPTDPAELAEFAQEYGKKENQIRMEAIKGTVVVGYLAEHPMPEDPKERGEWLSNLNQELKLAEEADKLQKEQKEVTVKASGESDGTTQPKEESKSGAKDQKGSVKAPESAEAKIIDETSMLNALRLAANQLMGNQEERKQAGNKIQEIHKRYPNLKPSFLSRVRIARTIIIAAAGGLTLAQEASKESPAKAS